MDCKQTFQNLRLWRPFLFQLYSNANHAIFNYQPHERYILFYEITKKIAFHPFAILLVHYLIILSLEDQFFRFYERKGASSYLALALANSSNWSWKSTTAS